jgi:DNA-binding CsgD family transcriptional regulator
MMQFTRETVLMAVLGFVVIASGLDLYTDTFHGASISHIVKEATIVVLATALIIWILMEQRVQAHEIAQLKQELARSGERHAGMSDYVQAMRQQLSDVVSKQFADWQLTASENEVGWLLLKGLSLKEIAVLRNTLEKTVRQQASAIYRKADLSGRHAFSAWFIEDLL